MAALSQKGRHGYHQHPKIDPMPVITGNAEYPEGIISDIESKGVKITALDALSLAEQAGTAKAVNLVLLGCAPKTPI